MLALLAALVSPIDGLGEDYLFSAHMVQHVLLGDIAPLLLLLSLSRVIMRPATRRLMRVERALGPLASPLDGDRDLARSHVPLAHPGALRRGRRAPAAARARAPLLLRGRRGALVAAGPAGADAPGASPACSRSPTSRSAKGGLAALGLFLAWSSTAHYPCYEHTPRIWGLSPVEDQNVAGVIMMVEQSLTLAIVLVWQFVRMLTRSEQEELRRERLEEAQVAAVD